MSDVLEGCSYFLDKIKPLSDDCNCYRSRLWSSKSSDVFVPRTKTKMGDWALEVAGPRTWNSLSATIIGNPKPFLLSKNCWKCTWSVIASLRYCDDSERTFLWSTLEVVCHQRCYTTVEFTLHYITCSKMSEDNLNPVARERFLHWFFCLT